MTMRTIGYLLGYLISIPTFACFDWMVWNHIVRPDLPVGFADMMLLTIISVVFTWALRGSFEFTKRAGVKQVVRE